MMGIINLLKKRPSDHTIHILKILIGVLIIGGLYYNLIYQGDGVESNFFWLEVPTQYLIYIKYTFIAVGLFPLFMGISNMCLLKKKYMKIVQGIFALLLFYISSKIIPGDPNKLDIDTLIGFLGIFPLFTAITGKCITTKCLKFGETVTKIRV